MNTVIEGVQIVPQLQVGNEDSALELLRTYYAPLDADGRGYAGGRWDAFDPSGTRAASPQVFTADDLLACSLLSAPIPPEAMCQLLEGGSATGFNALLRDIPTGSDFVDVDPDGPAFEPVHALFRAPRGLRGVGETRATKLLARKRPFLVPIVDGVVRATAFPGLERQWKPLYLSLNADNRALDRHLRALRTAAGFPDTVPTLRVFDVVPRMSGMAMGNSEEQVSHAAHGGHSVRAKIAGLTGRVLGVGHE